MNAWHARNGGKENSSIAGGMASGFWWTAARSCFATPPAVGDIAVALHDADIRAGGVAKQDLAAVHQNPLAIPPAMLEFSFPPLFACQAFIDLRRGNDRAGAQEEMHHIADGFGFRPPIHLLRATVPAADNPVGIGGDDGVAREVDQFGLPLQFIALTG